MTIMAVLFLTALVPTAVMAGTLGLEHLETACSAPRPPAGRSRHRHRVLLLCFGSSPRPATTVLFLLVDAQPERQAGGPEHSAFVQVQAAASESDSAGPTPPTDGLPAAG